MTMMMMSAYQQLEHLATELVGDGKSPNLYFVTVEGTVQTITTDRRVAYAHWAALRDQHPRVECALEDREHGVLASIERKDPDSRVLEVIDEYLRLTGDTEGPATTIEQRWTCTCGWTGQLSRSSINCPICFRRLRERSA